MKYKIKITVLLVFLFGFICFAFYDSNLKGKDEVVLVNEIFSTKQVGNTDSDEKESSSKTVKTSESDEEVIETSFTTEEDTTTVEVIDNSPQETDVVPITYTDTNKELGEQIVDYALNFVGNPYVYGGNSLTNGTDCSGFTKLVYGHFGIYLPRVSYDQQSAGYHVSLNDIQPGDIVLSGYNGRIGHASIYIGNNQLVHALNENAGIVVTNLYIMPIIDVRRVV